MSFLHPRFGRSSLVIFFLTRFFTPGTILSQSTQIDSLESSLRTAKTDSIKILYLDELAWQLRNRSPVRALAYAKEMNQLSKAHNLPKKESTSLVRMASIYRYQNDNYTAIKFLRQSVAIEKEIRDFEGIGRASGYLCTIYRSIDMQDSSLYFGKMSLDNYCKTHEPEVIAKAHGRLALTYQETRNYKNAVEHHLESLELKELMKDSLGVARTCLNLGALYILMDGYRQSIDFSLKAKAYFEPLYDRRSLAKIFTNLGVAYEKLGMMEEAIQYHQKGIELKEEEEINKDINYLNLGNIYFNTGETSKAKEFFLKSLEIKEQIGDSEGLQLIYNNLGEVHRRLEDYPNAIESLLKSEEIAESRNSKTGLLNVYANLTQAHASINNHKEASAYYQLHLSIKDSLDNSYREAVDIKAMFEKEKREKAILAKDREVQQVKIEKQYIMIIALVSGSIVLLITIIITGKLKEKARLAKKDKELKDKEIKSILQDQELKSYNAMLQGQENERHRIAKDLHDQIGGMLTVAKLNLKPLEEYAIPDKESELQLKKVNDIIDEVCVAVRDVAHDMASGELSKFGLVPALLDMKDSLEKSTDMEIEMVLSGLQERLPLRLEVEIYRSIQELISNVLKHSEATELSIQVLKKEKYITILVEDNGKGFDMRSPGFKFGLGIRNIESRIENMDGSIEFDSVPARGTTANIKVPITNESYD